MLASDRNGIDEKNNFAYGNLRDSEKASNEDSWINLSRFVLTILLRIGFYLVQAGSVPVTNINLILLQNIVEFSWITIVYVIGGYVIAYNGDVSGLIGQGQWIGDETIIDKEEILVGWQATIIASAICTCCLVGRTHTIGYLLIALIMSAVVQPFAIHWAWTTHGWMLTNKFFAPRVAFLDYGGSTIVHTVGSLTGYVGCAMLGRRIIRLRDIDGASLSADSPGTALAGYLLIFLGLQSLCLPSTRKNDPRASDKEISMIIVNNLLGASSCSLAVIVLHFVLSREPFNHWTVMRCVQASIAGTTIISAGVNLYNPIFCLGLGFTGGIIHYLVSRKVFQSALEDYCNVVATHLVSSLIGTFVAPFGRTTLKTINDPLTILVDLGWQVICLVAIVALVTVPMTLAFGILECLGLLRNRPEIVNHLRAIIAAERGPPRAYMQRLFLPEGETRYLQPSTMHVRRQNEDANPRVFNHRNPRVIETNKPKEVIHDGRKVVNSEDLLSPSSLNGVARSTRPKKSRQVHTLSSTSVAQIFEAENQKNAMGDDGKFDKEDKTASMNPEDKIYGIERNSMMECSGDSTIRRINGDALAKNFNTLATGKTKDEEAKVVDSPDKNLKRRREPYRLHRTQKSMNLQLEAIEENDTSVKFLVRPSSRSLSSSESDSEDESFGRGVRKYPRNLTKSVPVLPLRKTHECRDTR